MNTLQAIAHILKIEGIEWIGCFPSNNLIEAVAQEGIRPLMFRQERGALMAADGFSRLNNQKTFGVVITHGGPGAVPTAPASENGRLRHVVAAHDGPTAAGGCSC